MFSMFDLIKNLLLGTKQNIRTFDILLKGT